MATDTVFTVEIRERTGTGGARETRRNGLVPGVIYGGPRGSIPIELKLNELTKRLTKGGLLSKMIEIEHKGERQPVIIRAIQFDVVTDTPIHVDLYRVEAGQMIVMEIPVRFLNEDKSPGLKRGGALNIVRHAIELEVPASNIPDHIDVDLTGVEIGDSIHISAVSLPADARPTIRDRDFTIATIAGAGGQAEASAEGEAEG